MSIPGAIGAARAGALGDAGVVVIPGIGAIVCAASADGAVAAARATAHPSAGRRIDKTSIPLGSTYYVV